MSPAEQPPHKSGAEGTHPSGDLYAEYGQRCGRVAAQYLEDNGLQQTMTVECLGDPELISGNAVLLRANSTGVTGLCWIDSDTHTWKNGQYFCRLSLNFRSLTNEVEAGREL